MEIKYLARNFHLTPAIKKLVEEKINKFSRIYKRILRAHVELNFKPLYKQGKNFKVEIRLEVPGKDLYATCRAKNFSQALDKVEQKIKAQLRDLKNRPLQKRKG